MVIYMVNNNLLFILLLILLLVLLILIQILLLILLLFLLILLLCERLEPYGFGLALQAFILLNYDCSYDCSTSHYWIITALWAS